MSGSVYLESERLILREFTSEDAPLLFELNSDPEVMRYITDGRISTLEEIESEALPRFMKFYQLQKGLGYWAAYERVTQAFIGWYHLRPDARSEARIEFGYRFKRSAWGNGYATEGARAIVQKAFNELGIDRIVANAMEANSASIHLLEKVGFRFQERYRHEPFPGDDKWAVLYCIDSPIGSK